MQTQHLLMCCHLFLATYSVHNTHCCMMLYVSYIRKCIRNNMIICIDLILSREIWIAEICRVSMGMSIQISMNI